MSVKNGVVAGVSAALTLIILFGLWQAEQHWQRDSELSRENRDSARVQAQSAKISTAFKIQADMLLSDADELFSARTHGWSKFHHADSLFQSKLKSFSAQATDEGERDVYHAFESFEIRLMTCVSGAINPGSIRSNNLAACDSESPTKLRKDLADQASMQAFWQKQSE